MNEVFRYICVPYRLLWLMLSVLIISILRMIWPVGEMIHGKWYVVHGPVYRLPSQFLLFFFDKSCAKTKKLFIFAPGISNRQRPSAGRCKGIRWKTGAVPAAVTSIPNSVCNRKATVAKRNGKACRQEEARIPANVRDSRARSFRD